MFPLLSFTCTSDCSQKLRLPRTRTGPKTIRATYTKPTAGRDGACPMRRRLRQLRQRAQRLSTQSSRASAGSCEGRGRWATASGALPHVTPTFRRRPAVWAQISASGWTAGGGRRRCLCLPCLSLSLNLLCCRYILLVLQCGCLSLPIPFPISPSLSLCPRLSMSLFVSWLLAFGTSPLPSTIHDFFLCGQLGVRHAAPRRLSCRGGFH